MASWRSMTKIAEDGSGATSQRHGSADPDPYQNVTDPQHCGSYKSNVEPTLHCVPFLSLYFLTKCPNFIKNLTIWLACFLPTCGPSGLLQAFFWMLLQVLLLLLLQVAEAYGCARERSEQTPGLPRVRQTVPHQKAGQYCQPVPGTYWCEGYLCVGTDSAVGFFRCCTFSVMLGDIRKVKNLLIVAILYCSFLEKNTSLCDHDVTFCCT